MTRSSEAGVVLVNVLVLLGLAATVVYTMLSLADISIARSQRFGEAGQALALVRGGEQSAIAALRRDLIEAPDIDHAAEPWAKIGQEAIEIEGGAFALEIADARGLFNVNTLADTSLQDLQTLRSILEALELDAEIATRIAASLALDGPVDRLADLTRRIGLTPDEVALLSGFVTALPGGGTINVNAAPVELLAILLRNPVQARALGSIRERNGFVGPRDVANARVILPPGVGYRSDLFRVRVSARIGNTVQSMNSLVLRQGRGAEPEVAVIRRENAAAAVSPPPPPS